MLVQLNWDETLCRRYTEAMRRLAPYDHRGVATRLARHLTDLPPKATVVEIASGPGFLSFELARLLREPELVLVDSALPMLEIATEEAKRAGLSVRTIASPAEHIALPDGSADVILCKNLMNCIDAAVRELVVKEMLRLLAARGRAFVVDFDANGSHLAALLIGIFARVLAGAEFHRDFRNAFARRLDPAPLANTFTAAGCSVSVERFGPSFMLVAKRGE